jgi:membrane associated rhomboid family serine protease
MVKEGISGPICTCTSIGRASMPSKATVVTRANIAEAPVQAQLYSLKFHSSQVAPDQQEHSANIRRGGDLSPQVTGEAGEGGSEQDDVGDAEAHKPGRRLAVVRHDAHQGERRTVKALIAVNIAVFVLQILSRLLGSNAIVLYFGLVPARVTEDLMLWQFVTYMFLHGGVFHIFFNMLTLFMFGNDLERYWGTRRFLNYYFITGIGAGLCSWIVAMHSESVIIGASGAIYGLLLAYGVTYPNRIVYLNFLLPVKVK